MIPNQLTPAAGLPLFTVESRMRARSAGSFEKLLIHNYQDHMRRGHLASSSRIWTREGSGRWEIVCLVIAARDLAEAGHTARIFTMSDLDDMRVMQIAPTSSFKTPGVVVADVRND